MDNSWIKSRQTKYGTYLFVYVVVVLAVLFAVNWLAKDHNKSVDLTSNKRFTLSEQTDKVVAGLKKPITLYYFEKADAYDRARDILDRYKNLNPGNINISYVDPDKKPDIARLEGVHSFGDLIVDNGVKKETAKSLTEEEITGAIIRDLKSGARSVCFTQGEGEHTLDDSGREGYASLKTALEKNNYKTQTVSLLEKPEVPKDCNIVVIGGPKHDLLQPEIEALKTYVAAGGHLLVNLDAAVNLPDGKMGDTPGLNALVATWGVTPQNDVIVDVGAAAQMFGPMNPMVGSYEQHPIVRVMSDNATVFPLARSLDVKSPAEKLFSTGAQSFALTDPKPPIRLDPDKDKKGPFVMGAAATIGSGSTAGRVVVIGSSNWIADQILGAPIANRDLALNVMNWLSSDEDLISIRPKEPEDRRLRVTSTAPFFWIAFVLLPLAVIFSGVSVWWKRR